MVRPTQFNGRGPDDLLPAYLHPISLTAGKRLVRKLSEPWCTGEIRWVIDAREKASKSAPFDEANCFDGRLAQLVEHLVYTEETTANPTHFRWRRPEQIAIQARTERHLLTICGPLWGMVDSMTFSELPPEEIERRRLSSVEAYSQIKRERWQDKYQEWADTFYWKHGRCCAGCDHWSSDQGKIGACLSAPPVSGLDVIRSFGIEWSSYTPPPGQPFTDHDHVCGAFSDEFDWKTLDAEYLERIGATPILTEIARLNGDL